MRFYMFQMDESQPERCAEMLAKRGFSAVVGVSSARSIAALREKYHLRLRVERYRDE